MMRGSSRDGAATVRAVARSPLVLAGGGLAAAFYALPRGGWLQALLFSVAPLVAACLLAWRLKREGLLLARPWVFLLAGAGLYAVATPFWSLLPLVTGRDLPFPSVLDAIYFTSYVLSAVFLTDLIRYRHRTSEDAVRGALVALIDAGLFALAGVALLWPAVISLADPDTVGLQQLVVLGYPLLTAVLLGLVARLAITGGKQRSPALGLLLVWAAAELAGDILYGYLSATGGFFRGHPISVAWLVSYAALGTLAVHPGLVRLTRAEASLPLSGWRLAVPLGAVLVPGGVALVGDSALVNLVALVAVGLLLARSWLLSGDLAEQRRLAHELVVLSRRFEHQSLHDPLTGLANRSLFTEQLHAARAAHERHDRGLAVLMVDLDGFKLVNDRHGHHAGDQVLVEITERLRRCVRVSDTLARLGGDEFAIVLPETDLGEARTIAGRIHQQLAVPLEVDDGTVAIAASIGIAVASSGRKSADTLLREADIAMYAAKTSGAARTELYRPGLEHDDHVVLPDVATRAAGAWASYIRELRSEIADRKDVGRISIKSRAPASVHRTLEQVLRAIDDLDPHATSARLTLVGRQAIEEFVFHQTAVQHWADALAAEAELTARRTPEADRFWREFEARVLPPES
ncbi:GGDEF domain-containing protein [Nitriliruptor alkaliphilus]|uniref:GGDEF domain-containing protein n=1 Tax=Nitriliruptor alkaliphilus TaxID=427918 RepID=UPI000AAC6B87|nr:GGDEF domain-containing protein [Nitriliruptor alkaliphilus]